MTVLKIAKNKKTITVITDEGEQFRTSTAFVQGLINGKSPQGFILLSRLPEMVSPDRFKPSPLWDPDGVYAGNAAKTAQAAPLKPSQDVFGQDKKETAEQKAAYVDKVIW